jgi:translation elongation factor EF-Ts
MHWWFRVPFLTAMHLVALFPEVARIVGLVTLEPEEGGQRLEGQELEVEVGASLAMHVVAAKPLFLSKELVAGSALQQELDIFRSQVLQDFFV